MSEGTGTSELTHLPGSDVALRTLHLQIEELAAHASQARITRTPVRIGNNGAGCEMTYWYDGEHIKVFTCEGGLFISGIEHFGHWPDWYSLPAPEARAIANALWSATVFIAQAPDDDPGDPPSPVALFPGGNPPRVARSCPPDTPNDH